MGLHATDIRAASQVKRGFALQWAGMEHCTGAQRFVFLQALTSMEKKHKLLYEELKSCGRHQAMQLKENPHQHAEHSKGGRLHTLLAGCGLIFSTAIDGPP